MNFPDTIPRSNPAFDFRLTLKDPWNKLLLETGCGVAVFEDGIHGVLYDPDHPNHGWLLYQHVDGGWVTKTQVERFWIDTAKDHLLALKGASEVLTKSILAMTDIKGGL